MDKVRVGIIGLGHNGVAFVEAYNRSEKAELIAIADYSQQKRESSKAPIALWE